MAAAQQPSGQLGERLAGEVDRTCEQRGVAGFRDDQDAAMLALVTDGAGGRPAVQCGVEPDTLVAAARLLVAAVGGCWPPRRHQLPDDRAAACRVKCSARAVILPR
ncbi:hypothetical protein JOL79_26625 [Microbispora sp. RL4-1S]|uniref:Uncharacterized protein n=1 Tax=Microbispora oryzae TaxID=2806554 RepID=A0A941AKD6_9ACTN|nr:hypothetical protein [Microbispora oryzae]MBP2707365.1 hypothetical protein [Microbispora oryzae]